jgi:nitrite reductase/ring-hydroxylating ferredoxin subunit
MELSDKDKELNPSARGVNRYVSRIVRCPKHRSKISVSTCLSCPHYKGLVRGEDKDFITCVFDREIFTRKKV